MKYGELLFPLLFFHSLRVLFLFSPFLSNCLFIRLPGDISLADYIVTSYF